MIFGSGRTGDIYFQSSHPSCSLSGLRLFPLGFLRGALPLLSRVAVPGRTRGRLRVSSARGRGAEGRAQTFSSPVAPLGHSWPQAGLPRLLPGLRWGTPRAVAARRGRGGRPEPRSLTLAGPALPSPAPAGCPLPQLGLLWPAGAPCAARVGVPGRPAGSFPPGGGGAGVWAQAGRRGPRSTSTCRAGPAPVYVFGGGESCSSWAWSVTWTCPRVVDEKYITEKYRIWMKGGEAEGLLSL